MITPPERVSENERAASARRIFRFFEISLFLKGADAVLELVGGVLALAVSPAFVKSLAAYFTAEELGQDPNDFIATHLVHWADGYAVGPHQEFFALYLLSHGIIKLALVAALLAGALWAFPAAIIAFSLFAAYQVYLLIVGYSTGMLLLTLLDLVVIYFIFREWRIVRARSLAS